MQKGLKAIIFVLVFVGLLAGVAEIVKSYPQISGPAVEDVNVKHITTSKNVECVVIISRVWGMQVVCDFSRMIIEEEKGGLAGAEGITF